MTSDSCLQKQTQVVTLFAECSNDEEKYKKIIALGKASRGTVPEVPSLLVSGCQSKVYLQATLDNDKVYFKAQSDALISAGLAEILIQVYSGESPKVILTSPPNYLKELGLDASLTPSRANGLYSIHLKMQQEALRLYTTASSN